MLPESRFHSYKWRSTAELDPKHIFLLKNSLLLQAIVRIFYLLHLRDQSLTTRKMSLAMRNFDENDFFAHFGLPLGLKGSLTPDTASTYNRGISIDVKEVRCCPDPGEHNLQDV